MTIATVGKDGQPWAAPVAFAYDNGDQFMWVSAMDCVHSRNLESNPKIAMVIIDDKRGSGTAQALYCQATARVLSGEELVKGCELFYARRYPDEQERQAKANTPKDLRGSAPRRLYAASVSEYSLLHPDKHPIYGSTVDRRVAIRFSTANRWPRLPPTLTTALGIRVRKLMWS